MLRVFEELARDTGAELSDLLDEVMGIECRRTGFTNAPGEFSVEWEIQLGWTSLSAVQIVSEADIERGHDWLIECYTKCILDSIDSVRAFYLQEVNAIA